MSLRRIVQRNGFYLVARQIVGTVLTLAGLLLLTRWIGPAAYGLYAVPLGIATYAVLVAQLGINTYLIRKQGPLEREEVDQALTLALGTSLAAFAALAVAVLTAAPLLGLGDHARLAVAVFAALPFQVVGSVFVALLERALNFRAVAAVELAGIVVFYAVALPLAAADRGAWAPAWGWVAMQATNLLLAAAVAGHAPRPRWERARVAAIVGYGIGFSGSVWVWQARLLVNPLVVAPVLGAQAAGIVAICIKIVDTLCFVRRFAWRLSIAAMARVQDEPERILGAIRDGMRLQVLGVAPTLLAFSVAGPVVVPLAFGEDWAAVSLLFPFVATASVFNAVFNIHSSALYAVRSNGTITRFHLLHIVVFAGAAVLLVPRVGLVGYGFAELAALAAYLAVHRSAVARFGAIEYQPALAWAAGLALMLFWQQAPAAAAAGLLLALLWPGTIPTLRTQVREILRAARKSTAS